MSEIPHEMSKNSGELAHQEHALGRCTAKMAIMPGD